MHDGPAQAGIRQQIQESSVSTVLHSSSDSQEVAEIFYLAAEPLVTRPARSRTLKHYGFTVPPEGRRHRNIGRIPTSSHQQWSGTAGVGAKWHSGRCALLHIHHQYGCRMVAT